MNLLKHPMAAGLTLVFAFGYPRVGATIVALLSIGIATTFAWLWWRRATPLAAGLAFAWAGIGVVMAGTPGNAEVASLGVSLVLFGAVLHCGVIHTTGASRILFGGILAALLGSAII